jgi:UDP-N-acetylglucosamine--N-acetylmuramyl-(pentapeptide) pyrophosphoryl-undecaprenol N-acetylglucosamine transferase
MAGRTHNGALRVLIAASGSGGHLIPAVQIARELIKLEEEAVVEFLGSGRPLEAVIIDAAGFKRHVAAAEQISGHGLAGLFRFAFRLPQICFQTWKVLSDFRPDIIIGVGGYVTFMPVTLGWLRGIPTWIHEAESKPGIANLILSLYASGVSLAVSGTRMARNPRAVATGQPVRDELVSVGREKQFSSSPRRLLVLGGSQGARALDLVMLEMIDFLRDRELEIWHQCRSENQGQLQEAYQRAGLQARVAPFIEDMTEAFRWSDIIVSRAGLGAVREIGIVNRPAIFVPFPYAQANHQFRNAEILSKAGKALIVEEGENFRRRLEKTLAVLMEDRYYSEMKSREFQSPELGAAKRIVDECLKLV